MHRYNFLRIARFAAEAESGGESGQAGEANAGGAGGPKAGEQSADAGQAAGGSTEGEAALGDAGKKALDAMKAERAAAKAEATAATAALAALQAKLDGKEAEHAAEQEKAAVKAEALAAANDRILHSEVKAAAKGVLEDPQDAYKFLDLKQFEVDEQGNVDEDAIAEALKDLIAAKPYLAAQGGQRFQGGADGGARNGQSKSIDQEIAAAEQARDFQTVIALKQRRAAELAKKS